MNESKSDMLKPSAAFEERLFASAEVLLEKRRERRIVQESFLQKRDQKIQDIKITFSNHSPLKLYLKWTRALVLQPAIQMGTLCALIGVTAFFRSQALAPTLTFADLPDFPKLNLTSEQYEAQRLAERTAYIQEAENEQNKNSGGQ